MKKYWTETDKTHAERPQSRLGRTMVILPVSIQFTFVLKFFSNIRTFESSWGWVGLWCLFSCRLFLNSFTHIRHLSLLEETEISAMKKKISEWPGHCEKLRNIERKLKKTHAERPQSRLGRTMVILPVSIQFTFVLNFFSIIRTFESSWGWVGLWCLFSCRLFLNFFKHVRHLKSVCMKNWNNFYLNFKFYIWHMNWVLVLVLDSSCVP